MKYKVCVLCALLLCVLLLPVSAASPRLMDEADLLSSAEEAALLSSLDELSERHNMDVVVVTADTYAGYETANSYADYYFLDHGYGQGPDEDGVILVIFAEDREFAVSTYGSAIGMFDNGALTGIFNTLAVYYAENNWADGCEAFVALCDDVISTDRQVGWLFHIGLSVILGFLIALIIVTVMKSKLKSVYSKAGASDYTCEGSMHLTVQRDIFLYHTVTRRLRPKDTSSGTRSSGGSSFGGGSRKF